MVARNKYKSSFFLQQRTLSIRVQDKTQPKFQNGCCPMN